MINKIIHAKLVYVLALVVYMGIVTSCDKDKDEEVNSGKVELLSFGPTGANHGDTLRFIGNNLQKVTAIQFTGETPQTIVEQKDFKQITSEFILLTVPTAAEKGYVTLKTPEGDIVSKTQFNLGVIAAVMSMTEEARPGENVTITGNYLNWVTKVTFARNKVVETFVSQSLAQLVVTVPVDAESGPLILTYGGTESADIETADTLKVTLPLLTAISPSPVKAQTNVTIDGTNLDLAKKVIFNGVSTPVTTFVSQSATQLVVKVPEQTKKGKLILEAASGVQTISNMDLDIVLPAITTFSPSPINLGTNFAITGTDLDLVKKVIFAGVAPAVTAFVSQSATQVVVKIPAGTRKGKITLEAASGVQIKSDNDLDVVLPSITSMSPNPIDPGTNLTITGAHLDLVSSISFQNAAAAVTSFVSQSPTQLVVTMPSGAVKGKILLGVSNPTDTVQSANELTINGGPAEVPFKLVVYDDAINANWQIWGGWGSTIDPANTSNAKTGSKSIKIIYSDAYGGFQFHPSSTFSLPSANYTTMRLSIYAADNATASSRVALFLKGTTGGDPTDAQKVALTIVPGTYKTYEIPLSAFTNNPPNINEFVIQNYGTANITIYIDEIGFY